MVAPPRPRGHTAWTGGLPIVGLAGIGAAPGRSCPFTSDAVERTGSELCAYP